MLWLVSVHALGAVLAPLLVRKLGRAAFLVLALAPAAAFVWALTQTARIVDGQPIEQVRQWIPAYGVSLAFRLDPLGLVLLFLASGIGALVLVYCARYFDSDEPGLGLFACSLTGFAGAMIGLVLADDLILLFVFWELTTILSFLLIGHYADRPTARRSALRAVSVTTFGGLALLAGVVILGQDARTYRLSAILAHPPHGTTVTSALVLILVGCFAKSAVFPFSQWLPGAMAAPTPVSAYLHAAAMVKAGVYLIARLTPAYGGDPTWQRLCLILGGATMLLGGVRALRERDLKRVLAFGTVSQLGFLTAILGAGTRDTAFAGLAMLLAHAVFKAPLFLGVGIIDHSTGTRDLRKLSGLARSMPALCVVMCLAALSMAAIPPMLGFAAKESVLDAFVIGAEHGTSSYPYMLAVFVAGSALTVAYTCRVVWGAFAPKPGVADTPVHAAAWLALGPAGLLALAGLVVGIGAPMLNDLLSGYADAVPGAHEVHLYVAGWGGFGLPLLLSAIAWVAGGAMFIVREPLLRFHKNHTLPEGEDVVNNLLLALERASLQITGSVQRGSLPVYVGSVFLTAVALGAWALVYGAPWHLPSPVPWWASRTQLAVAVLTCLAVICVPLLTNRLAAALVTGVSGFAVAILFLVDDAPDLAFTQLAAETVSLIVFVLVLRRLDPSFVRTQRTSRRAAHLLLAVSAGVVLSALTYVAEAARQAQAVASGYGELAHESGLENIVSAIIVDFRAWDTLGESSVIAICAAGVTSLVFARRAAGAFAVRSRPERAEAGWLAARPAVLQRSLPLEVVARLTYHTILLVSLYLLLHGEYGLGGGFVAGLLAGLGLVMRYLAGGRYELAAAAPIDAGVLLGLGMALASGTALLGYAWGDTVLAPAHFTVHLPVTGSLTVHSSLLFDFGVYVLVIGLVLDILRSFGSEIDRHIAADREAAAEPTEPAPEGT
ncbi:Na+/H+ antiporter subunit A [Actinospica sp. MGRD01-02]|uniref:Na+/H+ antiporter subunit A n=1 Tax=Actinospica acidithermotolerans TaxID=2828514 RepID=A0A941EDZ4_9ACTN|nr:Na+/H+ antiporter subunit A [Actinospica acidithermotolerans]MBR7828893.1 Na+/H+ antiporter subunit A [Actinospica acidithermotolerans]